MKAFLIFLVVAIVSGSVVLYSYGNKYERFLMFFRNKVTGEVQLENRYITLPTEKDSINVFIEEFLFGPASYELIPFFSHGTTYRSFFVRDNILYLDLYRETVLTMPHGVNFEDFYNLFNKSLKINFPEIKATNIFIEGAKVYEKTAMSN